MQGYARAWSVGLMVATLMAATGASAQLTHIADADFFTEADLGYAENSSEVSGSASGSGVSVSGSGQGHVVNEYAYDWHF